MEKEGQADYLKICIYYRVLSIFLSTCVYFVFAAEAQKMSGKKILVGVGMVSACFLGAFLYQRIREQGSKTVWLYLVMLLEIFSYGIFVYLSGGIYSPFLWYCIGCLFLPMSLNQGLRLVVAATVWYLACTFASQVLTSVEGHPTNLELNTAIGVVMVVGGFYTLAIYIRKLNEHKKKTELALNHITDLYDSFHLFTMSDLDKTMEQLMGIIGRTVAPYGGLLIKFNGDGEMEWHRATGFSEDLASRLQESYQLLPRMEKHVTIMIDQDSYEALQIGTAPFFSGMLIRPSAEVPIAEAKVDTFYESLIDTVFKNIDVQKELEDYIISEEQKRLADEIHDTVIQKLFGIACKLKLLEHSITTLDQSCLMAELQMAREAVESAMRELREAIYGKRFMEYDKQFYEKLKAYMEEVAKLWAIQITVDLDQDVESLPVSQKLAIYKTVCEAVNNAVRHGEATVVTVKLMIDEGGVHTVISDDGKGFQRGEKKLGIREGNGLNNMQRLAKVFKGKCMIESQSGSGTQVTLYLPR